MGTHGWLLAICYQRDFRFHLSLALVNKYTVGIRSFHNAMDQPVSIVSEFILSLISFIYR